MANRALRQFSYGGILVLIIGAVFLAVYWQGIFPAPTCSDGIQNQGEEGIDCGAVCGISCEEKYLKDLSYANLKIFRLGDFVSVYFDLINNNPNFGLKNFKYKIDFYGFADKLLGSAEGASFIYPGETKKIVEAGKKILGDIRSAQVSFSDVSWRPAADFRSIKLENIGMKTAKEGDFYVVSGKIKNLYSFVIPQVVINAFIMDNAGNVLAVSKTEVNQLEPFTDQAYRVFAQISPDLEGNIDFSSTQTYIYPIY